ncbi:MAG: guanylate kinase [Coriobacteriia bacterium]
MHKGNLFIISGPSGAGKGTLVKELLSRNPDVWVSVSVTTRKPRPGEIEGREYCFISQAEFDELRESGGLLESACVHDNWYGTPKAMVEKMVALGKQVILEIDPQGAFQVKELIPQSVLVFVMPPSFDELKRRLMSRGSETEEQIGGRLKTAECEIKLVGEYDHVVINDDVLRATGELERIVEEHANPKEI